MRKNATKIAALALSLALTVTSVNIPTNASAATVKLNKTKATLYASGPAKKKTTTLKVTGTKKTVTFTSSKKSVATVNKKGKVTAKKAGKATITAKVGKKSYKCKVTVKKKYTPVTSVSVNKKSVSLAVGKTSTIKATVKPAKATQTGVTYKSNKTSVATVSSKGKITAKKAGSAKITVTTKGITKSGSNKKATVAVTVTKDDTKPTDAPSTAPSDTPSDTPTDTPTDVPTDTPTTAPGELGKITELKATKSTQLTATFDSDVPADTKIEVTKGNTAIDGKSAIDEASKNVVTFDATAKFTTGTYTLTATLGEAKVSADVEVKDSYVAEIKITSKEALTGNERQSTTSGASVTMKDAYIYYDVLNQYGESIRNATTINWTTSVGNEGKKIDKSLGKITVSGDSASLNYGTLIYVTGVHVSSGTTISASIPVGMAQAVNTVEFAGFINKDASTKLVESLPVNFPNNKYVLAYRTFDQNGNPLEVTGKEVNESKLTFISDNVLLIDPSSFKDAGTYTIDGVQYSAVTINPGDYVGKGGEVNITAIANKTGQKTVKNFVVGSAGVLQSLTLDTPASVVADGDQWVKLPYTAKDADGKNVTNYETIVRSSNALNLTAGDGTLYVMEENDGTAGVYWCDDASKATTFNDSSEDGIDRSVSLGTMVIGGESNMMILPVSDARRPVAIKSIKLNSDDNNAIVDKNTATINFYSDEVVYLDQYGSELKGGPNNQKAIIEAYLTSTVKGNMHGIKVKTDDNNALLGLTAKEKVYDGTAGGDKVEITATNTTAKEASTTVKFSIVTAPSSASYAELDRWDNVDNEKSIEYTVVPIDAIKGGFSISKIGKQEITTDGSELANFEAVKANASGSAISIDDSVTVSGIVKKLLDVNGAGSNAFSVTGIYNGKSVTIPGDWYEYDTTTGSAFIADIQNGKGTSELTNIVAGELTWAELYDQNSAKGTRIDAIKELRLIVRGSTGTELEKPKTRVTISDAKAVASNIRFIKDWWQYDLKEVTFLPDDTNISVKKTDKTMINGEPVPTGAPVNTSSIGGPQNAPLGFSQWGGFQIRVFDQYGTLFEHDDGSYADITVSDIKESTSEFTHLPNSFKVVQNGSSYNNLKITGAEIGDTFTLTATIPGTNISTSVKVTVGADTQAYVAASNITSKAKDADKDFRMTELGYKK